MACKQAKLYATGEFWRHDPGLQTFWNREADGRPIIAHMYIDHINHAEMRERLYRPYLVRERVVISARVPGSAVASSLIRTQGEGSFTADDLAALNAASESIVALALKHISLTKFAGNLVRHRNVGAGSAVITANDGNRAGALGRLPPRLPPAGP